MLYVGLTLVQQSFSYRVQFKRLLLRKICLVQPVLTNLWLCRMDVPKAPKLLGSLVGLGIAENAVPITKLADLYGKVEDTETRRQGVAEALLYVKVSPGPASTSHL